MSKRILRPATSKGQGKKNSNWRHGFAFAGKPHPIYVTWCNIIQRCHNPKATSYPWYGAVGIAVCPRWRQFKNFCCDMLPTWKEGLEIDRRDSKGNYEPSNCRWSDHHTQLRNYARNHWIEFNGERKTICDWSISLGGRHSLIRHRLRLGWTIEKALTTPAKRINRGACRSKSERPAVPVAMQ